MNKTELIHFHNLLGTLSKRLHDDGIVTEDDLREYAELGTSPMTLRGSRADHEAAVLTLAETLADAVETARTADVRDAPSDDAERAVSV